MVLSQALICFHKANERIQRAAELCKKQVREYRTKVLLINKCVDYDIIDAEFFLPLKSQMFCRNNMRFNLSSLIRLSLVRFGKEAILF